MSSQYDNNHVGIQEVENLRKHMSDEAIKTRLSSEAMAIQVKVNSGSVKLEQSHIDRLKTLEVAQTYVSTGDISNSTARAKLINAQKGLSATGQSLMSTVWQKQLDSQQKAKPKTPSAGFTVQLGRTS